VILEWADPKGRKWHPYSVTFESPDGMFVCYLYAISADHAQLQLEALRETAEVQGRVVAEVKS